MINTGVIATKLECFWVFENNCWRLSDFTGEIFQCENGRKWLKTPTGLTEFSVTQ